MYIRSSVLRDRLESLTRLHSELDTDIRGELERPRPDTDRVQMLKRMRMRVKDRLSVVSTQYEPTENRYLQEAA